MDKKHQKHAKLKRASVGNYHRHEYAVLGTACSDILAIAHRIGEKLPDMKVTYVDTEHKKESETPPTYPFCFYQHRQNSVAYITKQYSVDQQQYVFNESDVVIVNGNHHEASKQILVIDSRKDLNKKRDLIKHPIMVLLNDCSEKDVPSFIKQDFNEIPVFDLKDDKWIEYFNEVSMTSRAAVNSLVLTGGKSTRMGRDKGSIVYHGMKQREFMYNLVDDYSQDTYLSVSIGHDMINDPLENPFIKDKFVGLGVYGAILSAFQHEPDSAWLVVACDLPLVDGDVIDYLMQHRNPSKFATAFYNPETDFPDPLLTIWEPRSYAVLLNFLARGYSCPRKVLINSDIELLKVKDTSFLKNVNTPEEYLTTLEMIKD